MAIQLRIKNKILPVFNREDISDYDKLKIKGNYVPIETIENNYPNKSGVNFRNFNIIDKLANQLIMPIEMRYYMRNNYPNYITIDRLPVMVRTANYNNVNNMNGAFYHCEKIKKFPYIYTSNVQSFSYAFAYCKELREFPLLDFSNATFIEGCFDDCINIKTFPQFNFQKVSLMNYTFFKCDNLESTPQFNTPLATQMKSLFYQCYNLKSVGQLNTANCSTLEQLFYECKSLTTIPWDIDMTSCTNCDRMFKDCPATNIKLKNVPKSLDLSLLGLPSTNYTVMNYI